MNRQPLWKGRVFLSMALVLLPWVAFANNIAVSGVQFTGMDSTVGTVKVQFTVSWENSWRDAANHDAAWVFGKYTSDGGYTWSHLTLKGSGTNPTGFSTGASGTLIQILVPSDTRGAIVQRAATGTGTLSTASVQFLWNYTANGLSWQQIYSPAVKAKMFGIEMVYIPSGSFRAGDGYTGYGNSEGEYRPTGFCQGYNDPDPWMISSEAQIIIQNADVNSYDIYYNGLGDMWLNEGATYPLPAVFPKGYGAFYMMKYELAQGQYRDFLNTLTRTQQANRTASQSASYFALSGTTTLNYRSAIRNPTVLPTATNPITFGCDLNLNRTLNETNDGEWIAADSYLSANDLLAYADWAALRPMTELEYEKACRGQQAPVFLEYAWGTTQSTQLVGAPASTGFASEAYSLTGLGVVKPTLDRYPMRCGFAAKTTTSRITSGAAFYGVMELTGNITEDAISVSYASGRAFSGSHGNGALTAAGVADAWVLGPGSLIARGYTNAAVEGGSGGISDRDQVANYIGFDTRGNALSGGRLVRTTP